MNKFLFVSAIGCSMFLSAAAFAAVIAAEGADSAASIVKASYLLPKAAGDEIRKNMREADEENHAALKKNIEKDRAEMRTLLTAPAFDRKAFLTKAKDLRDLQTQGKENQDDAFAAAAVQLSSEERAAFAHALDGAAVAKPAHHADAAPTSESKERFQSAKESELSPAAGNN